MERITHCPLTGYLLQGAARLYFVEDGIDYTFRPIGRAKITGSELLLLASTHEKYCSVLAGVCRNRFENNEPPPLINYEFIVSELAAIDYPKSFDTKLNYFIKFLYSRGGREHKSFNLNSNYDYPICYSDSQDEFIRIVDYAQRSGLIEWAARNVIGRTVADYRTVHLTPRGIKEVEKELPKMPMIGLVEQEISAGDLNVDQTVKHAKELFFRQPQTLDRMRSACESLSYILEPLREDLKTFFQKGDVSDFFNIVNNFDIRHNKESTKEIQHPEQLEWVFYSLLNTINTYTKLKAKHNS